jgi:hypothetical protein
VEGGTLDMPVIYHCKSSPKTGHNPAQEFDPIAITATIEKEYFGHRHDLTLSRSSEVLSTFGEPILSKNIGKSAL